MVTLWLRKPPYLYIIWLVLWNIYGSCHHPNALSIIFQDGYVKTTKQIVFIHLNKWLKTGHKNSLFTIVTKFCSMNKWILHGCSRLKNRRFHHSPGSPRIAALSQEEEKVALMGLKVLVKHWENWGSQLGPGRSFTKAILKGQWQLTLKTDVNIS